VLAIYLAINIMAVLGVILIVRRALRPPDQDLLASTSVRIAAFGIDFAIIFIINDILLSILTGSLSTILTYILYTGLFAILSLPLVIFSGIFSYLLFFLVLLTPYGIFFVGSSLFIIVVGFVYFFLLESLTQGKTVGKAILRIRTVKRDGYIPISVRESALNALGKSFLLFWDISAGFVVQSMKAWHSERKQFRILQQISDVVVINTRFDITQQNPFAGPDWWADKSSRGPGIWEEKNGE
jgi:uncharacterized RDD family membrane protein YckC